MAASNYVEDTVSGQYVSVVFLPPGGGTGQPLGGLQRFDATIFLPSEVVTSTDRKARKRVTGPTRVEWTADRWIIRNQSLIDVLGLTPNWDAYGNYNWQALIFDIANNFTETANDGLTAGTGGWSIHNAWIIQYQISTPDPYQFVMENVQGLALGFQQQNWG